MAIVYRAIHKGLNKPVALKVLHEAVAQDTEYRERFLREGKAAAKLNHPNVVRAYEAGEHEGTFYFAMELVEGEDLSERLARGTLNELEALEIAHEIASALEAAEANGMVHRDVKPENVLLGKDGQVKLADLGLAKVHGDGSLTTEGYTLGTVAFFSPEQCRGTSNLDIRSDLYALGALLYNVLTGELPHGRGDNPVVTMERILREDPRPLAEQVIVSPSTVRLVESLMAKRADDRPRDAAAAVALINATIERVGQSDMGPIEPPNSSPLSNSGSGRPVRARRTRRRRRSSASSLSGLLLLALCLGVGAALFLIVRQGNSSTSTTKTVGGNPR